MIITVFTRAATGPYHELDASSLPSDPSLKFPEQNFILISYLSHESSNAKSPAKFLRDSMTQIFTVSTENITKGSTMKEREEKSRQK
jgi:hypothetical protein